MTLNSKTEPWRISKTIVAGMLVAMSAPAFADEQISDISGMWQAGPPRNFDTRPLPTAHGQNIMDNFELTDDLSIQCKPFGAAQQVTAPYPRALAQSDDVVIIHYEVWETGRTIYTDGRTHPEDLELTRMGHSIGWYEEQTLVVETVAMAPHLLWVENGIHGSEELKITERYTPSADGKTLNLVVTFEDPVMLKEPWTVNSPTWSAAPGEMLYEYQCENISGEM